MQLPLAGDRGRISRVFHHRAKRGLVFVERSECDVIPDAVATGHDLDPARSADRFGVTVIEPDAPARKSVEPRCSEKRATVTPVVIGSRVVRHDEDDVEALSYVVGTGASATYREGADEDQALNYAVEGVLGLHSSIRAGRVLLEKDK